MDCVRDLKALHTVSMPPLLKVHFKGSSTPVTIVTADLALVLDSQAVKLVQPVRNRLSIPSQRQILRVVDRSIAFFFR
jgi:hypothetical protein